MQVKCLPDILDIDVKWEMRQITGDDKTDNVDNVQVRMLTCVFLTLMSSLRLQVMLMIIQMIRAGHLLIFSMFAIRSPLNFFPWIADAHAFIF